MIAITHETDFYSWTQQQASLLRQGRLSELDIVNLIEEIEDLGASERRELENRLSVLLMHLLKWGYQPDHRSTSWEGTIRSQRFRLKKCLRENPGLKPRLTDILSEAYKPAIFDAMSETGLKLNSFPTKCPWSVEQVLDDEFWPE